METEDLTIVDIRLAFSRGGGVTRDQVGLAGGMVNIDRDGVISIGFRELSDMVNSDNLPGLRWSFLRLEGGFRMTGMLVPLTDVTASNVVLDEGRHATPPIVSRDQFECTVFTRVAGKGRVMAGLNDFGAELFVVGYVELIAVVQ